MSEVKLNKNSLESEVFELKDALSKALSSKSEPEIIDILKICQTIPMNIDLLRNSKIGNCILEIKAGYVGKPVCAEAKKIAHKWRKDCKGSSPDEAATAANSKLTAPIHHKLQSKCVISSSNLVGAASLKETTSRNLNVFSTGSASSTSSRRVPVSAQRTAITPFQTVSLTFGDAGENHVGMEMVGKMGEVGDGFSCDELHTLCAAHGGEFVDMGRDAGVAVFRRFADEATRTAMLQEMNSFEWDDKFFDVRRKKVLNKHARTNVVLLEGVAQEPDYENKKGRIVDTTALPVFSRFKKDMFSKFGGVIGMAKLSGMICEGNNYFDNRKCGIGFHGDAERRRVIALRLGAGMDMKWQWFHDAKAIGDPFEFRFEAGDLYMMSEKAVGTDWRSRSLHTLRHSAGCEKYTTIPTKNIT